MNAILLAILAHPGHGSVATHAAEHTALDATTIGLIIAALLSLVVISLVEIATKEDE